MNNKSEKYVSCIILAGGRASRMMGQDKGLVTYHGRPLIEHVLRRIRPQVDQIIISANRNIERYSIYADYVFADQDSSFSGPLSGIASCLPHCRNTHVLIIACDMPNLPIDLVAHLSETIQDHEVAIASCDGRQQLVALFKSGLLDSIKTTLASGEHRFLKWVNSRDTVTAEFTNTSAFTNINSLDDLAETRS